MMCLSGDMLHSQHVEYRMNRQFLIVPLLLDADHLPKVRYSTERPIFLPRIDLSGTKTGGPKKPLPPTYLDEYVGSRAKW
jgi:hypothetical protein